MLTWAPVFHFYQPPTQDASITQHALKTSYLPFLDLLLNHTQAKATLNITSSLTQQIDKLKHPEFFDKVIELRQRGQVDLINSPFYHPLVPLTPALVIKHQLKESADTIKHFYGEKPLPGIFPPELAVDASSLQNLSDSLGFALVDESSVNPNFNLQKLPQHSVRKLDDLTFLVSSRAVTTLIRAYPRQLKAGPFLNFLENLIDDAPHPIISVNDVEVFGHHYEERLELLQGIVESRKVEFLTLTEVLDNSTPKSITAENITTSSWETTRKQLKDQIAYPLWSHPKNRHQKKYLQLAQLAYEALQTTPEPKDDVGLVYTSARKHYDKGISSCHLYWLSNAPWWHPELAEMGARKLVKAVRTLPENTNLKKQAETLYAKLTEAIWQYHWSGEPYRKYEQYDKQREEMLSRLPNLEKHHD